MRHYSIQMLYKTGLEILIYIQLPEPLVGRQHGILGVISAISHQKCCFVDYIEQENLKMSVSFIIQ